MRRRAIGNGTTNTVGGCRRSLQLVLTGTAYSQNTTKSVGRRGGGRNLILCRRVAGGQSGAKAIATACRRGGLVLCSGACGETRANTVGRRGRGSGLVLGAGAVSYTDAGSSIEVRSRKASWYVKGGLNGFQVNILNAASFG